MNQLAEKLLHSVIPAPHLPSLVPPFLECLLHRSQPRDSALRESKFHGSWEVGDGWNVFLASQEHWKPSFLEKCVYSWWLILQDYTSVQLWVKCAVPGTWTPCYFFYEKKKKKSNQPTNKHIFRTKTLYKLWLTFLINWELNTFSSCGSIWV